MQNLSIQDLIIFLVAAGLVVPAFKRLNVSPVLGFMIAGMCVGPYGLATLLPDAAWLPYVLITEPDEVRALAEVGIIFLLFTIGLELSLDKLWSMRRLVLGMGNLQVVVTGVVIGGIAYVWGNPLAASIILGGCLALSSTAMVLQLLVDQDRFSSPVGHASFSILLAQDLAVVPLLFLVAALGQSGEGSLATDLAFAIGRAALAMAVIFISGRLVLRPLFRFVGQLKSPELFMATILLVIITTATLTHAAGLSAALGAFLAGLLLAESEYRHEIELYIEPFKGLLLGLFFMSVSMGIDLSTVAEFPLLIFASVIGLFALKTAITTLLVRGFGFGWRHAGATGVMLAQGGEFAFVVIGLALGFALLPDEIAQFMLIVVSGTMLATPLLAVLSRWLERHESNSSNTLDVMRADDISDHVILVGYGRTGRLIGQMLNQQRLPFLAIDNDPERKGSNTAAMIHVGDATHEQSLTRLRAEHARALVICINESTTVQRIIETAKRVSPELAILVRAHDEVQAEALLDQGAHVAVPAVLESGLQLANALLAEMDVPEHAAAEIVAQLRQEAQPAGEVATARA